MSKATGLVSIIIPCYNAEKWVAECIQSCLDQAYENIEIIFIDDGSTDKSVDVVKSFNSPKIKIITQENLGACAARNRGFAEAQGDWIQYLDADDFISENKIQKQLEYLTKHSKKIAACFTKPFTSKEQVLKQKHFVEADFFKIVENPASFLIELWGGVYGVEPGVVYTSAWLASKKLLEQIDPWNSEASPDDDGEYFCRAVLASEGVVFVPGAINYHRETHSSNVLSLQKTRKSWEGRLFSIGSKAKHLFQKSTAWEARRAIAQQYLIVMSSAYPDYPDICNQAKEQVDRLGFSKLKPLVHGRIANILAGISDWRAARIYQYMVSKFRG